MEDYVIAQNTFPDFFYQKNEDGRIKIYKKNERELLKGKQTHWRNSGDVSIVEWYRKEYGMKWCWNDAE